MKAEGQSMVDRRHTRAAARRGALLSPFVFLTLLFGMGDLSETARASAPAASASWSQSQDEPETPRRNRRGRRSRGDSGRVRERQQEPVYRQRLAPYAPIVAGLASQTVQVKVEDRPVALGTLVEPNLLLTKASEIRGRAFELELSKSVHASGVLVHEFREHDLALVRIQDAEGKPVRWHVADLIPGTFVASADADGKPVAVGVVSASERSLSEEHRGYFGVALGDAEEGVRLTNVVAGQPAAQAGLSQGDIVIAIDDESCDSPSQVIRLISSRSPGEVIRVQVRREGRVRDYRVTLASRAELELPGQADSDNVSNMGTALSGVRTGFPRALQHDSAIRPQDCGGPLVDLEGRVIGINIARASRVSSYAITAAVIQDLLAEWRATRRRSGPH